MNNLLNPFGVHEQALGARTRRLELIASNIANADTPRFKARDLDFKQMFASAQQDLLTTTNVQHFVTGEGGAAGNSLMYRVPFSASEDGNTVEMSVEQAAYGKAAADYRATLNFIDSETASIKRALRGE